MHSIFVYSERRLDREENDRYLYCQPEEMTLLTIFYIRNIRVQGISDSSPALFVNTNALIGALVFPQSALRKNVAQG